MKKIVTIIFLFSILLNFKVLSQDKVEEKHNFITYLKSSNHKNFFAIDFTQFKTKFEKVYFVNQLYQIDDVIVCDKNLDSDSFLVSSFEDKSDTHIKALILGEKLDTESRAKKMSEKEKKQWLKIHDKFTK